MNLLAGIILAILFGILPMAILAGLLTLFDRYEREPFWLMLGVFLWGFFISAGVAILLNTLFGFSLFALTGSEGLASVGTAVLSAPIVEETVKGLAVLIVFIYFRHEFDSILDGVLYGGLVGYGFAAAENINYIFTGFVSAGAEGLILLVVIRVVLIPFLHATLTAFTGIGLAVGRLNNGFWRVAGPVGGYLAAIFLHFTHNLLSSTGSELICLFGSVLDWLGFVGMFIFILVLVWREGKIMREQLQEEVRLGNLSEGQYHTTCSLGGQVAARWGALAGGRWRQTAQFYDACGELAFKKYQLARLGPAREGDAQANIAKLRGQLARLSAGQAG
ncbi:MAG: PrsW family intramembrane metalloprotease [Anaerolineales bacterium]|nr:PrsW family intramembrane metalloprotease [Anaerolineales bacterium]